MEDIAPVLQFLLSLRAAVSSGESIRCGAERFIEFGEPSMSEPVRELVSLQQRGKSCRECILAEPRLLRRASLEILLLGLSGHPVQQQLDRLIDEVKRASEQEIKRHVESLPLRALLPLLLLQFPAFLLLVFGPLIKRFLQELAQ